MAINTIDTLTIRTINTINAKVTPHGKIKGGPDDRYVYHACSLFIACLLVSKIASSKTTFSFLHHVQDDIQFCFAF